VDVLEVDARLDVDMSEVAFIGSSGFSVGDINPDPARSGMIWS